MKQMFIALLHPARDFREHRGKLSRSRTVHSVDAPGRDLEQEGGFVGPGALEYACDRFVPNAALTEGLCVGVDKACRGPFKPLAHTRTVAPEATGAQISQEIADIERRIRQAETVQIHHENPLILEEHLAGFEPAVGRTIRVRLKRLQADRELVSQPSCRFSLCR